MEQIRKKILYYISSHGYGHAARSGQVIRELLPVYDVHIKTTAPEWLLESVIGSKCRVYREACDTGCIQVNNMDVDEEATISAYLKQSKKNLESLGREVNFVKKEGFDLVISDISSFPFAVAREASVPSMFIGNFTWKGIYGAFSADCEAVLKELDGQYGEATLSMITPLAMDMPELQNQKRIGLIARRGRDVREKLAYEFNIPQEHRLVFLYPGNLGFERVDPSIVERIRGCTFVSFYRMKLGKNCVYIESGKYRHQDIMASADIALIKPGYGMISEAMVNKTPLIYPPREDFCEYFAFLEEFRHSGGTFPIGREEYESGNWAASIERVFDYPYLRDYPPSGGGECRDGVGCLLSGRVRQSEAARHEKKHC